MEIGVATTPVGNLGEGEGCQSLLQKENEMFADKIQNHEHSAAFVSGLRIRITVYLLTKKSKIILLISVLKIVKRRSALYISLALRGYNWQN